MSKSLFINQIPALLTGEESDQVYLFVHGKLGCKEESLAFAEIANVKGWQVLAIDLPEHGERKEDAAQLNPWTVVPELNSGGQ